MLRAWTTGAEEPPRPWCFGPRPTPRPAPRRLPVLTKEMQAARSRIPTRRELCPGEKRRKGHIHLGFSVMSPTCRILAKEKPVS